MGRSAARIPRQNLLDSCSEPARNDGARLPETKAGSVDNRVSGIVLLKETPRRSRAALTGLAASAWRNQVETAGRRLRSWSCANAVIAPQSEWGSKGPGIAHIPSVDHPLMDGTDGILVSGSLSCWR